MTHILAAINAIFIVCVDRREEFLNCFQQQINHLENVFSMLSVTGGQTSLVQAVLGEDEEVDNVWSTFHCHLKFQCGSKQQAQLDIETHPVFLNTPHKKWQDFVASNPFKEEPKAHVWLVASADEHANEVSNPKPLQSEQQPTTVFCLNADLHVQPQHRQEFLEVLENARSSSIREQNCLEYQYGESMTVPNTFHVHQEYIGNNGGKEGFDYHPTTAHYKKWKEFAATEPFSKPTEGHTFRTVLERRELGNHPPHRSPCRRGLPLHSTKTTQERSLILLDGGTGHELKQRGVTDGSFLAGLLANEKQPDIVKGVHRDFVENGCHVITTNSFVAVPLRIKEDILAASIGDHSTTPVGHEKENPDEDAIYSRTKEIICSAVRCARDVAQEQKELHQRFVRVAGTVPPLTECYVAKAVPECTIDLIPSYTFILSTLVEAGVDIILAETLSTKREAIAIIRAYSQTVGDATNKGKCNPPLWISFTIDDFSEPPELRSGELLEDVVHSILHEALKQHVSVDAIGVNCASPLAVTRAIKPIVAAIEKEGLQHTPRIIAYANAFKTTTSEWLSSLSGEEAAKVMVDDDDSVVDSFDSHGVLLPEKYAKYTKEWRKLGVSIIGGCCGCSPSHMKAVALGHSHSVSQ